MITDSKKVDAVIVIALQREPKQYEDSYELLRETAKTLQHMADNADESDDAMRLYFVTWPAFDVDLPADPIGVCQKVIDDMQLRIDRYNRLKKEDTRCAHWTTPPSRLHSGARARKRCVDGSFVEGVLDVDIFNDGPTGWALRAGDPKNYGDDRVALLPHDVIDLFVDGVWQPLSKGAP